MKPLTVIKSLIAVMCICGFVSDAVSAAPINETDTKNLLFLKQEEKIARDVYLYLSGLWPEANTFQNISVSEQQHMDAVDGLLVYYGLTAQDTTQGEGDAPGVFADPSFQDLYDSLTGRGEVSLEEALYVGVFIEEMDIKDLTEFMEATTQKRIDRVMGSLCAGSYNHLEAFTKALDALQ